MRRSDPLISHQIVPRVIKSSVFSTDTRHIDILNKVFMGGLPRNGTYQSVYRSVFDCDGDGFISHADFEGACRKL